MEHTMPKAPAPLLAVIGGLVASGAFGLGGRGLETVGAVSGGLPGFLPPDLSLVPALWPAALGIALMSFTETIAAGRTFVGRDEPRPTADRELFAIGVANVVGGFFRIMPAGGGTSQTAVNRRAGATSQTSSLVLAGVVVAVLLFLSPVIAVLPQATLAAVVVATTIDLLNPRDFHAIRAVRSIEFRWALIALAGVVLLGSLQGIIVAIVASLFSLAHQSNHPPVYELARHRSSRTFHPRRADVADHETFPGLLILRTEGRVYFANAERVGDKMWPHLTAGEYRVVLIDLSAVPDLEYTALRMLTQAERKLATLGITLWLAGLNPEVERTIHRCPLGQVLGDTRVFPTVEHAVAAYLAGGGPAGH
jgi:anti-anti-sigma factor